ncbi:MAG: lactate transporter LctP family [Limisphaerales bacterium]|nr:MAG: lactate transporter LctP family [Limisphaerales bacterium]KAG0507691.1 MAG: lactate transporter LctP family [Limisphaerales bacterium]TXT52437.1 MAG: lactate transporter LctP family [Limisphaerales bacterium]
MQPWPQNYDPLGNTFLSTLVAALPVVVLLGAIAWLEIKIHLAALLGLGVALAVALFAFHMPVDAALATAGYGAAYGLFPIGWIILNLIFLYQLTVDKGLFAVLRGSLANLAPDPRVQLVLIAFSFGAFFEGAAGFGTPVAVTAAILMQLGFKPLQAAGLSLIANTAPVAYGALGTPIIALAGVTGLDLHALSAMVGRQLPFFSLVVPFWVVWAYAGWRGMLGVWPAALTAGVSFAIPQFLVSNFHGPWLVDIVAAICSMAAVIGLLKVWKPTDGWKPVNEAQAAAGGASVPASLATESPSDADGSRGRSPHPPELIRRAWVPWILLSVLVFIWGVPQVKQQLDALSAPKFEMPRLHNATVRTFPVVPKPTPEKPTKPEEAVFKLNWLSATGTGILVAAILAGLYMGFSLAELARVYRRTLWAVRFSLITIAGMLAVGYVTKYSGTDATLGLALAQTGALYPFFGTLLGWLGVALTGSDTASNVLFGSLQRITAEQTGIAPVLMCAANSSGGVMGKMVDAQSIVVASTATNWYGHEGSILRYVFFHSIALAALVGILVYLQAYVPPFTGMVVK